MKVTTRWLLALTWVAIVGLAACGTLEPNSSFQAAGVTAGGVSGSGGVTSNGGSNSSSGNGLSAGSSGSSGSGSSGGSGLSTSSGVGSSSGSSGVSAGSGSSGSSGSGSSGSSGTSGSSGSGSSASGSSGSAGTSGSTGSGSSGQADFASDTGVTPTSITIGNVTGVSGALGPDAFGVTLTGLKVWVAAINAQGGINGRKIILDSCDDGQDAGQNLTCTQTLIPKVFAFLDNNSLSSAGSAHPEYAAGVPDVGFPLDNGYYKYPNMFSLDGTDYPRNGKLVGFNNQVENTPGIFKWFALNRGVKRAAYFYYSESSSQQEGVAEESEGQYAGIKNVYEGGGSSGEDLAAPNFDSDVLAMKGLGANAPQAIFDALDVDGNQKLCESMDRFGFTVTAKVSTIEVWDSSIGQGGWSSPCRDEMYVGGTNLSYSDASIPQVAKYLQAFKAYAGTSLQAEWTLQAYAGGVMFADDAASMGADLTRKGFISWLDNLPPPTSPNVYTTDGYSTGLSYRVDNPATPRPDCNLIAQWQDSAGTWVTRAPLNTCYQDPLIATASTDDGS